MSNWWYFCCSCWDRTKLFWMLWLLHVFIFFQIYSFPFPLSFHQIQSARLWDKAILFPLPNLLTPHPLSSERKLSLDQASGSCWPEAHLEKAPGLQSEWKRLIMVNKLESGIGYKPSLSSILITNSFSLENHKQNPLNHELICHSSVQQQLSVTYKVQAECKNRKHSAGSLRFLVAAKQLV